jgi:hypothetical protein
VPRHPASVVPACLAAVLAITGAARADENDLLSTVYTENGYELRLDERIFTLYAALNVAGYTRGETLRELPFPRQVHHPVRERVNARLSRAADKLRPPVELFLDTRPAPLESYVTAALLLGGEPDFKATAALPKELAGLDKLLADFSRTSKLPDSFRELIVDYRADFKRLRTAVDQPFAKLRAAYRLKEEDAAPLAIIPNPLDAPDAAYARIGSDGAHVVVMGIARPDRPVDLKPALAAYSALLASEAVASVGADAFKDVVEQLKSQGVLAADQTPATMVVASLRAAVEAKLWGKDPAAEAEAAFRRGLLVTRELLRALGEPDEAFPEDKGPFVAQVLAKVDAKKVAAELAKAKR